jgi:glycyl-tRNA synthetase alpha chain
MVLQRVDSVYDLEWAPGVKYRDVRLRDEIEQSKYVFNVGVALPDNEFGPFHRRLFDEYYRLAQALLQSGLIWPALEHTLKCSHLFNILDARGAISVTERVGIIARVRALAVGIAKAWVSQRAGTALPESKQKVRANTNKHAVTL